MGREPDIYDAVREARAEGLLTAAQIDLVNRHNERKRAGMIDHSKIDTTDLVLILNELARRIHENACNKGFYEERVSFPQAIALIHSEASEALEAHRNAQPVADIEEEMADIIIRVMDTSAYHGFNLGSAILNKMDKNTRREKKHGKRY